jgi:hypothetical protein
VIEDTIPTISGAENGPANLTMLSILGEILIAVTHGEEMYIIDYNLKSRIDIDRWDLKIWMGNLEDLRCMSRNQLWKRILKS